MAASTTSSGGPSARDSASAAPPAASATHAAVPAPGRMNRKPAARKHRLPAISGPEAFRIEAQ